MSERMESRELSATDAVCTSGKFNRMTQKVELKFPFGMARVSAGNFDSLFGLFEELGLDAEVQELVTFHKVLESELYDDAEKSVQRATQTARNLKVIRDLKKADLEGLTFSVGTMEGMSEKLGVKKAFAYYSVLIKE